ncbi:MAG: hypothetical protein KGI25_03175, partial [Thaumarchaeota archaeon]|nr:hypothetical protein [Nitrososphaerota archaeon]
NTLYQEIFPFLYITSKTMQVPCPAYKLAEIAKTGNQGIMPRLEQVEERHDEQEPVEETKMADNFAETEKQADIEAEIPESLIEEQKITTV